MEKVKLFIQSGLCRTWECRNNAFRSAAIDIEKAIELTLDILIQINHLLPTAHILPREGEEGKQKPPAEPGEERG